MRKIKLQIQVSINGKMVGEDGSMDWMLLPWSKDLEQYVDKLTSEADTILLGRKLAEGFIPHWQNVASDHTHPEHEAGKVFSNMRQIVLSRNKEDFKLPDIEVCSDLPELVSQLKLTRGKDVMVYGGCEFVNSLLAGSLVDEVHLFVNPAMVTGGVSLFNDIPAMQRFTLLEVLPSSCGIVVLVYKPVNHA